MVAPLMPRVQSAVVQATQAAAAALEGAGIRLPTEARDRLLDLMGEAVVVVAGPDLGLPVPCKGPYEIGCDCEQDCALAACSSPLWS